MRKAKAVYSELAIGVSLLLYRGVGRPSGAPCWPKQDVGRPTTASLPTKAGFSL